MAVPRKSPAGSSSSSRSSAPVPRKSINQPAVQAALRVQPTNRLFYTPSTQQFPGYNQPAQQQLRSAITPQKNVVASGAGRVAGTTDQDFIIGNAGIESERDGGGGGQQAPQEQGPDINALYAPQEEFLANLLREEQGQEGQYLQQAISPYEAQRPLYGQARQEALRGVESAKQEQRQREASALAEARAIYNEYAQANRQRFGGATSTGEFASELQGRDLSRSQAGIRGTTSQNIQALTAKAQDVESKYTAQIGSLEQQKAAAEANARQLFRDRIASIQSSQFELGQNKAQAIFDAAREFNAQRQAITQQAVQFKQSLDAAKQQADLQLRNALAAFQVESGKQIDLGALSTPQFSTIGQQQYAQSYLPTGQVRRGRLEDFVG